MEFPSLLFGLLFEIVFLELTSGNLRIPEGKGVLIRRQILKELQVK